MDIDEEGTTRAVTNDELDDIQEYFTKGKPYVSDESEEA